MCRSVRKVKQKVHQIFIRSLFSIQHYLGMFKKVSKLKISIEKLWQLKRFCKNELGNQVLGSFQCAKVERTGQAKLILPDFLSRQCSKTTRSRSSCVITSSPQTTKSSTITLTPSISENRFHIILRNTSEADAIPNGKPF